MFKFLASKQDKEGKKFSFLIMPILVLSLAFVVSSVKAGSLAPPGAPSPTGYTLADIYLRLTTGDTATEGSHPFSPPGFPSPTMYTLTEIYEAIPTINAEKVLTGTSYLGVMGNVFADLRNGTNTAGTFLVDDFNNGGSPSAGRYEKGWTQCVEDTNWCGLGSMASSTADSRDNSTGLIWSLPCRNNAGICNQMTEVGPTTYSWDNSHVNNGGLTAAELCSVGEHGITGWRLPHQKELLVAYVNGSYGNLELVSLGRDHWSASTVSSNTNNAWRVNLSNGSTINDPKTNARFVRCVRPAP